MAQRSLLHRQGSLENPNFRGYSSQQVHFVGNDHQEASTSFSLVKNPRQILSMAQPYSQQQIAAAHQLDSQQWSRSNPTRHPYDSAPPGQVSSGTTYTQNDSWAQGSISCSGLTTSESGIAPQTVLEANAASYASNDLIYPQPVSYDMVNQGSISYGLPRHTCSLGFPCGMSTNESDHETNSSYSPKSYISEASDVQPFTPHSVPSDICSISNWNGYGGPSYARIKSSSSQEPPSFEPAADNEMSGAPLFGLGITMPSTASISPSYNFHGLPLSYDTIGPYGSDFSCNQKSSPSASSWSSAGQSLRPRAPPTSSTPLNSIPTRHEASSGSDTSGELRGWSGSRANVASQEQSQARFHSDRVLDTPAQRKADDEILLEGKRDGLTYKEIRRKMHVKCAESTLRGRYRSLTKARQDRVRKPVWREKDIELLTEFVMRDLHRIDTANNHALSYDQRLAKVQWKKVADAIRAHGGSYHFGNSTCKRKWQELHPRR